MESQYFDEADLEELEAILEGLNFASPTKIEPLLQNIRANLTPIPEKLVEESVPVEVVESSIDIDQLLDLMASQESDSDQQANDNFDFIL